MMEMSAIGYHYLSGIHNNQREQVIQAVAAQF
jgi:hypothetical protein